MSVVGASAAPYPVPCRAPTAPLTVGNGSKQPAGRRQQASHDRNGQDRMAIFLAYAKVLEPDDPTMLIYKAGMRACPGQPGLVLAEVLRRTGGVYETTTP